MSIVSRGQRVTCWPPERHCDPTSFVDRFPPSWTGDVLLVDGTHVSVKLDDGRVRWFMLPEVSRVEQ